MWGCLAYCKSKDPQRTKLGPRGIRCAFIGNATHSKAYRHLNLESNVIIESRDVEFFEHLFTSKNKTQTPNNGESKLETSFGGGSQIETVTPQKYPRILY